MKTKLVPTIEGNYSYLAVEDTTDGDFAPLLEVRFVNEFTQLPKELKISVARNMLECGMKRIRQERKDKP